MPYQMDDVIPEIELIVDILELLRDNVSLRIAVGSQALLMGLPGASSRPLLLRHVLLTRLVVDMVRAAQVNVCVKLDSLLAEDFLSVTARLKLKKMSRTVVDVEIPASVVMVCSADPAAMDNVMSSVNQDIPSAMEVVIT
jgi:hypothetical protein